MRNCTEKTYLQKAIYVCGNREVKSFIVWEKNGTEQTTKTHNAYLLWLNQKPPQNSLCSVAQKQNKTRQPQDLYKDSTREREKRKPMPHQEHTLRACCHKRNGKL